MLIIAILDIWKTTLFYEGESVVYDGFKYVWPIKGYYSFFTTWLVDLQIEHTAKRNKPWYIFKKGRKEGVGSVPYSPMAKHDRDG